MIFSPEEYQKKMIEGKDTQSNFAECKILAEIFEEQVEKNPNNIALIFANQTISYRLLNEKANQVAHYIRENCPKDTMMVAVCMEPSFDVFISIIGILKAGAAYIPLDPHNPAERLQFILEDTQAQLIITHQSALTRFQHLKAHLLCLDTQQKEVNHYPKTNPNHINKSSDLAYIIYTSGSTGTPKGVLITHLNIGCFIHWFAKALVVSNNDIFDFSSSISFDFAVANTLFPLLQGAKVSICKRSTKEDPYLYINHLLETHVSIIKTTPSHFRSLKEVVLNDKKSLLLRYVVFGGETLFKDDIKDWVARFPNQTMLCEYGPTEATVATSWIKINYDNISLYKKKIPIGKPALNTQLYILDEHLNPVLNGEIGELYIGGKGVAAGYLNQKELTQKKFILNPFSVGLPKDRLYKTGDFCRFLNDGNIEFIERLDNQIKIRGYRVEMEEIEHSLLIHPHVKEAVVVAQTVTGDPLSEKQLVAYCVVQNNEKVETHELREFLQKLLPDYMIPTFFEYLRSMPLSPNGKLDRKQLPQQQRTAKDNIVSCTDLELRVKTIWEKVLNLQNIDPRDNFFEIGGHSLSAAKIITKIKQTFKKEVHFKDFYLKPTIKELAEIIQHSDAINEDIFENSTNATTISEEVPLSDLQFLFWLIRLFYPKVKISNIVGRKRLSGVLDIVILNKALASLCMNYPILNYHLPKYYPIQYEQHLPVAEAIIFNIKDLSPCKKEMKLRRSLDGLAQLAWKKEKHLLELRLFYLQDDVLELQIGISHLVSDEISLKIILSRLSEYYLAYINKKTITIDCINNPFKDYILHEYTQLKNNLNRDINFWKSYLYDSHPLNFSTNKIIAKKANTSSLHIPEAAVERLNKFCTTHRFCITESLTAAVGACLEPYLDKSNKVLIINLVKSTRHDESYDKAIGLFVRTDVIKFELGNSLGLMDSSKRVQQTIIDAEPYQSCPTILKLGFVLKNKWENKKIAKILASLISMSYNFIFNKFRLDQRIVRMFILFFFAKGKDDFFIDVNIMNSFISPIKDTKLFDLEVQQIAPHQTDKSIDRNVINISFNRDSESKPTLILSGNLELYFMEKLGKDIVNLISIST